mgnify:CR=1 FL=1
MYPQSGLATLTVEASETRAQPDEAVVRTPNDWLHDTRVRPLRTSTSVSMDIIAEGTDGADESDVRQRRSAWWNDGSEEKWGEGRMEGWKDGRMEGWKDGRMEGGKEGRREGGK